MLLSSHALTELEERAGRVIIMNRGIKVADGSLDELRRIARLPTKHPPEGHGARDWRACPNGSARSTPGVGSTATWSRSTLRPKRKIALLRRATDEAAPVEDLDVVPPTLDELYAHFLRSQEAAPMRNILIVARKEIQEGLRNRWVLATTLLLAALALTLTFLGSAPTGSVGVRALDVVIVSLSSLTIFLLPLIALLISHDAIVGEMERGTMLLLLSYPVGALAGAARQVRRPLAILAFATLLGYGAAAGALAGDRGAPSTRRAGRRSPR